MGPYFLAAALAFLVTAVLYYRGAFWAAGLTGIAFGVLIGRLVFTALGSIAGPVVGVLFLGGPAALLVIHAIDARKGLFLWPTIYAIPLGFLSGALLLGITGLAILL